MRVTSSAQQSPWFVSWFDSAHYYRLYANRNTTEAAAFIDKLVDTLRPRRGALALDVGCGVGRHSRYLAAKGFRVTGIDLAAGSIQTAKQSERPGLHFLRQDMRVPFGRNWANYVFNFFTSFGYFNNPDDDDKVVSNIFTALKPGGLLVMDYINAAYAEKRLTASEEKDIDGIVYHISRWTDDEHIFKKISIDEELFGRPLEYTEQVRKFSLSDFEYMFGRNGLEVINVFGEYQLNEYDEETSPRIIMIAKKIANERNIL